MPLILFTEQTLGASMLVRRASMLGHTLRTGFFIVYLAVYIWLRVLYFPQVKKNENNCPLQTVRWNDTCKISNWYVVHTVVPLRISTFNAHFFSSIGVSMAPCLINRVKIAVLNLHDKIEAYISGPNFCPDDWPYVIHSKLNHSRLSARAYLLKYISKIFS